MIQESNNSLFVLNRRCKLILMRMIPCRRRFMRRAWILKGRLQDRRGGIRSRAQDLSSLVPRRLETGDARNEIEIVTRRKDKRWDISYTAVYVVVFRAFVIVCSLVGLLVNLCVREFDTTNLGILIVFLFTIIYTTPMLFLSLRNAQSRHSSPQLRPYIPLCLDFVFATALLVISVLRFMHNKRHRRHNAMETQRGRRR
ncbi:hypothetical protein BKA63DRAFT_188725 [Paraphoma chrysanthemicola]|nr:hypothetical protein BKA63DRAFT_188725 [Paraphoma chrysanthemicola]